MLLIIIYIVLCIFIFIFFDNDIVMVSINFKIIIHKLWFNVVDHIIIYLYFLLYKSWKCTRNFYYYNKYYITIYTYIQKIVFIIDIFNMNLFENHQYLIYLLYVWHLITVRPFYQVYPFILVSLQYNLQMKTFITMENYHTTPSLNTA